MRKRELIIAIISFVFGVIATYLFLQNSLSIHKKTVVQSTQVNKFTKKQSNSESTILKSATELIKQKGYTVVDNSTYSEPLLAFLSIRNGSADGYGRKVFFFYKGKYLGTDSSNTSRDVSIKWTSGDIIALEYTLYHKNDAISMPTAGAAIVRFQWNGNNLVASDPIPSADWSTDISR